ncbi:hypothetical protein Trydic_g20890 [Trypoxylus dichotomus]
MFRSYNLVIEKKCVCDMKYPNCDLKLLKYHCIRNTSKMMSKKQWFVLLGLLIIYILLGSCFFYIVETREEARKRGIAREELQYIEELMHKHYKPTPEDTIEEIFDRLGEYCGKPMKSLTMNEDDPAKWDFYHSVFFVITVVTTVGYGNLAPTTSIGRIFVCFYSLIGVPVNGIVMVTLGDFFGKSFVKLYRRWKTTKMAYDTTKLNLITQIVLYLVPGIIFFIFLPAVIIMMFEGWDYVLAVYYAYITLTTIGFGDYVAGVNQPGHDSYIYTIYKLFLLVWIIVGLGYLLMVLGFITTGLRSKKMHAIEHALAVHIKQTPRKIRTELRALVHEFLLLKVKRVYKGEFEYTPTELQHSHSCPDLTLYKDVDSPTTRRKRAFSECVPMSDLVRVQSDTDLNLIDKEKTFNRKVSEQSNLLFRVANALSGMEDEDEGVRGINGFSDEEILSSEVINSTWTSGSPNTLSVGPILKRRRAFSEVKFPFGSKANLQGDSNLTWYGLSSTTKLQDVKEENQYEKPRSRTLSTQSMQPSNLLTKLKNTIIGSKEGKEKNLDIEKQEIVPRRGRIYSTPTNRYIRQTRSGRNSLYPTDSVLEETSVADFLRVLADIALPDTNETTLPTPQRKLGTACLTPPKLTPSISRRLPSSQNRRGSLINQPQLSQTGRRASLKPVLPDSQTMRKASIAPTLSPVPDSRNMTPPELSASPPPPYTPFPNDVPERRSIRVPGSNRRFSLRPVILSPNLSPVQRQVIRSKENKDESSEIFSEKL